MKSTAQFIVYGSGYLRACMIFFFHRKYQSLAGEAFKQYSRTRIKDGSGPEFSSVFGHQNWKKGLQNNKTRVRIVFAAGRKYANRTPFPAVLHVGRFTASQISPALAWIVFPASELLSVIGILVFYSGSLPCKCGTFQVSSSILCKPRDHRGISYFYPSPCI